MLLQVWKSNNHKKQMRKIQHSNTGTIAPKFMVQFWVTKTYGAICKHQKSWCNFGAPKLMVQFWSTNNILLLRISHTNTNKRDKKRNLSKESFL